MHTLCLKKTSWMSVPVPAEVIGILTIVNGQTALHRMRKLPLPFVSNLVLSCFIQLLKTPRGMSIYYFLLISRRPSRSAKQLINQVKLLHGMKIFLCCTVSLELKGSFFTEAPESFLPHDIQTEAWDAEKDTREFHLNSKCFHCLATGKLNFRGELKINEKNLTLFVTLCVFKENIWLTLGLSLQFLVRNCLYPNWKYIHLQKIYNF